MKRVRLVRHGIEHALRRGRPAPGEKVHQAEASDLIAWVLGETQDRDQVLHVCAVKELEPAKLHEWDIAAGELEFQRSAMAGSAEEHGLLLQRCAAFAILKHPFDNEF